MSIIQTLEDNLRQAMLTSDVVVLDDLIADNLVFTTHTGSIISKQDDLEAHRSGIVKFTNIEISDRQIHTFSDDCVVVTLKVDLTGIFNS